MTLIVDADGLIKTKPTSYNQFKNQPIAAALAAKHMHDFRYVSENFTPQAFDTDKEVEYLRNDAKSLPQGIDDMYGITFSYSALEKFIAKLNKSPDFGGSVICR